MLHNKQKEQVLGALLWDLGLQSLIKRKVYYFHPPFPLLLLPHSLLQQSWMFSEHNMNKFLDFKTNPSHHSLLHSLFRVITQCLSQREGALHREECCMTNLKTVAKETILIRTKPNVAICMCTQMALIQLIHDALVNCLMLKSK